MASEPVVLLSFWASPFGQRAQIALAEKGVEYEYTEVNLFGEESPLLYQSNPIHKKVPVLLHGGKIVAESLNIVQYIDEAWTDTAPILPSDPYARAQARFWADFVNKKVHGCVCKLWKLKGEALQEAKREMIEVLKQLEGELGDKAYFGGDKFGLVDIAFIPFASRFYSYETLGDFRVEEECPKLVEWSKRCMARESVAKSAHDPKVLYEFVCSLMK